MGERSRRGRQRKGSIGVTFAWRAIEMLESPPYRALSLSAHRVLARLEIELAHHGGGNSGLPCTYEHFEEYGIRRNSVAAAIRECVALGFVEITQAGCGGNADARLPTLYRLTYRHAGPDRLITDNWRRIKTTEEAAAIAQRGRDATLPPVCRHEKTYYHPPKRGAGPPPETGGETANSPPPETGGTVPPPETGGTSRVWVRGTRTSPKVVRLEPRRKPSK